MTPRALTAQPSVRIMLQTSPPFNHMHPDWQKFLQQQGADFTRDQGVRFAERQARGDQTGHDVALADLTGSEGLIEVSGPGRREFLQGQLSTDVRRLTPERSQFSSWNNSKGRVVAVVRIFERGESVLMVLSDSLLASMQAGLRLYILRSQVQIADASDRLARFGVTGNMAPQLLADCGCPAPEKSGDVTTVGTTQLIRLHGVLPRVAVHGEVTALTALWTRLRERGASPAGSDTWTRERIRAGEPCIHLETSGHFVAQMLGLEELDAVHFNKGCYLGQEVIARAHYRGTVKRHLRRGSCVTAETLSPGMEIQDSAHQAMVGEVVDAGRDRRGTWQLLAVLQDGAANSACTVRGVPLVWET